MKYLLFSFLLFSFNVFGQNSLTGFVKDSFGDPYIDMEITITQLELKTTTDKNGFYEFSNLPSGKYALAFDYEFDIEYRSVNVESANNDYSLVIDRRKRFDEVTVIQSRLGLAHLNSSQKLNSSEISSQLTEKDIPYVLESLTNVQVQSDAGNGVGYTDVRIRGIDPQHIQFSLNGVPLNDAESSRMYLVDLPDMINSVDELTVHSGYVPGRSGQGGFGASIDLFTNKLHYKPFAHVKTRLGSYHTSGYSLHGNTGLLEGKYNVELRLSGMKSDGFIDRSASRLKSFSICGTKTSKTQNIRLNIFHGKEVTQQAWNGLPYKYFYIDSLFTYNSSGQERPGEPYNNEVDEYKQTHLQLFYIKSIGKYDILTTTNYTRGSGFYENYKAYELLEKYNLYHPDTASSDIIRRKWLSNNFVYQYLGIERNWNRKLTATLGVSYSWYEGQHYGEVIWSSLTNVNNLGNKYYKNIGEKEEVSGMLKLMYKPNQKLNFGFDFHERVVMYSINGNVDNYGIFILNKRFNLFSPKAYVQYKLNYRTLVDVSAAYYQREPNRQDLLTNPNAVKEKLFTVDAGITFGWLKNSIAKLNMYNMSYRDYLAQNGLLNDTGDPLRINIPNAYRRGIEIGIKWREIRFVELSYNLAVSQNQTKDFVQVLPRIDSSEVKAFQLGTVDLAFSPQLIQSIGLKLNLIQKAKNELSISVFHKYVSSQYLDLSSREFSKIESYHTLNAKLNYSIKFKIVKMNCFFQLNNILNQRYSSHGWIQSYYLNNNVPLDPNPYLIQPNNLAIYKGLYPQALRHYSIGFDFIF